MNEINFLLRAFLYY